MDDLRQPVHTPIIACPKCGKGLTLAISERDTQCPCGFSASTAYLQEADYLRRGIPAWSKRLAELDRMIAAGERPVVAEAAAEHHGPAAYQIILAVGGFLIVAGIAAFSVIIENFIAVPIQIALVLATAYATVKLRTRMTATSSAMAVATAGAWWFLLVWLSLAFSDGKWWKADGWFPTTAIATTAIALLLATRAWKIRIWTYLGLVFAGLTPVAGSIWLVTTLNSATSINQGLSHALVALPLTALGILAFQRRIAIFPGEHVGQMLIGVISSATAGIYALASLPWVAAWSVCVAWAVHLTLAAALLASHDRTKKAVPFVVPFALAATAGFTFLTIWGISALFVAGLAAALAYRKIGIANVFSVPIAYISWLVVMNIASSDVVDRQQQWMTLVVSAATGVALLYLAMTDSVAWILLPAWPIILIAVGQGLNIANAQSLEQYTLPFAVITLGLGMVARSLITTLPSAVWLAPAAFMGLLPSSFASLGTSPGMRFWLVLAATVAMLLIGTFMNYGGLLLTGTVCAVIIAFQPLSDPLSSIPKWVSFAAAGVLLVLVGARFEVLRASITSDRQRDQLALR